MKIYLFNPETGVYLGEDFADEDPMNQGGYVIPPDATTIEPPAVERGQIPVFNRVEERWEVRPVGNMRSSITAQTARGDYRFAAAFEYAVRK